MGRGTMHPPGGGENLRRLAGERLRGGPHPVLQTPHFLIKGVDHKHGAFWNPPYQHMSLISIVGSGWGQSQGALVPLETKRKGPTHHNPSAWAKTHKETMAQLVT